MERRLTYITKPPGQYEKEVITFFNNNPSRDEFINFIVNEDLNSEGEPYVKKVDIIYNILARLPNKSYMNDFLSFHPDIVLLIHYGDYSMGDWIKDGKNEFFVSLFCYYAMDELRDTINAYIRDIIKSGDQEIFDLLVENGYVRKKNMPRLLYLALKYHNIPVIDFLLNKGAKIEPLHFVIAVETGDVNVVRRMIMYGGNVNSGADETPISREGETPLSKALGMGEIEIARELIGYGADVNQVLPNENLSLLMLVIKIDSLHPLVKDFIAAGANVNYRSVKDETPLSVAGDNEGIRALLIAAGATDEGVKIIQPEPTLLAPWDNDYTLED